MGASCAFLRRSSKRRWCLCFTRSSTWLQNFKKYWTAEATALTDEELLLATRAERLAAAFSLVVALGGGWNDSKLPIPFTAPLTPVLQSEQ